MKETKVCTVCKTTKELSGFRSYEDKKTGVHYFRSHCKACQNKQRVTRRKTGYKEWQSIRCKKQYYNRKNMTSNNPHIINKLNKI